MKKTKPSPETQQQAESIAKATQKPGQTKQQTKLIAKGIEHGIAEYKKQQKEKQRQLNKNKKKQESQKAMHTETSNQPPISNTNNNSNKFISMLGYVLFVITLLWLTIHYNTAHASEKTDIPTKVAQSDLVYMMTDEGLVLIQMLPQIAPNHAMQFKNLVKEGFYDGLSFYRVVDGFVAQAGQGESEGEGVQTKTSQFDKPLKAEFTRQYSKSPLIDVVQSPEFLAPETGYIDSVPAGHDPKTKEEWFAHCPGLVSMARNNEPDTGSTEFYINIGQAPRHLDRNMSSFGRVVYGLDNVQKMQRGPKSNSGVIADKSKHSKIIWVKMGSQMPAEQQKVVLVQSHQSEQFKQKLNNARQKTHPFFIYPGIGVIDVCYHAPTVTVESKVAF